MAYKELFPIVVAAHLWGSQWSTWRVEFLCDNESVVAVLSSGTSRDADLMVLLRYYTSGLLIRPASLCPVLPSGGPSRARGGSGAS